MGWLDKEQKKLRKQYQLKQLEEQQEKAQRNLDWQKYQAEEKKRDQILQNWAAQKLTPLLESLQLRKLMKDANNAWRREKFEDVVFGVTNIGSDPNALILPTTKAYCYIQITKHVPSFISGSRDGKSHGAYVSTITVWLNYDGAASPAKQYTIMFSGWGGEEAVTQYNHRDIIARLKTSLAQAVMG